MIGTLRCAASDGTITGARVAGDRRNAGRALIFVHGVGSTAAIWDPQLEAFSSEYLCAAVELRGNGAAQPDPDPARITRAGFADDVLAVAGELGIERFTLAGCSLGGVVAFELWRQAAERLNAIAILGSFARYPDASRYAQSVIAAANQAGSMRVFAERRAAQLGVAPAGFVEQMARKSVACYAASTQATWTGDYRDVLPGIAVPALVAYGAADAIAPRALAQEIAAGIPGAVLAEIPEAGHVANADNPAAFNALLRGFLTEYGL